MFVNNKISLAQQQRIQKYTKETNSHTFFNLLTSPELLASVEELLPEHRERLYPPTETLSMYLAQGMNQDRSCQKAVNDAAIQRIAAGLPAKKGEREKGVKSREKHKQQGSKQQGSSL